MRIITSKRMREGFHYKKMVALLFCIFGIAVSIPIHAQRRISKSKALSMSYNVPPEGYNRLGTTDLFYSRKMGGVDYGGISLGTIDLIGLFENAFYSSTYGNNGYVVSMEVNNTEPQLVDCLNGSELYGVSFRADVEQQGDMARVYYTITNNNETDAVVSLGVYDDVAVGNNISPNISRKLDSNGVPYGMTLLDNSGVQLCVLFGSGLAGVTGCDDFWFGSYYINATAYSIAGHYSTGSNYMVENGGYDCGIGWCWKNRTIKSGQTQVFSYLIAVGEVNLEPNSSFEVTPDDPEGWNDLSRPHKLTLEGTYESPAGLDGMIEYAVEDSEDWHQLTEMIPSGSTFNDSLVAMFDATREKHVIRFRTRDNVGNTTLLPSIEYLDVSFHEYSGIVDKTYTGDSIYQDLSCVDVEGLQISTGKYSGNVNAGTATFYIEGVFPYTIGRKACSFHINPVQLIGDINLSSDSFVYNGQEHLPSWSFTNDSYEVLEENKDYNVSYIDNIYPGTGRVRIVGKGNYTSVLEKTFFIDKAQLNEELYSITLPAEDISYDENEHIASATTRTGVGEVNFTYTLHGETETLQNAPVNEGHYDIYCEISDGDLYYGKANEYIGSFAIYRFDELEWQSLGVLFTELQQMNVPLAWNIADGAKNVGKFEELTVREGHVVGISLANKEMTGLFPVSLTAFSKLEDIDLSNNNLSGNIATALAAIRLQNAAAFSNLHTLNLCNNNYSGNVGILGNSIPGLTTLNVSNNKFEDLFPALPANIVNLDITHQEMDRVVELNLSELSFADMATKVPTILLYNHETRNYNTSINLLCTKADLATFNKYDTDEWAMQLAVSGNQITIPYVSSQNAYYGESGDVLNVLNMTGQDSTDGSTFRIKLSFTQGDANFVNGIDATDLQATILYAFGDYKDYPFNFTAANTYKDDYINIQDVICTVNILLNSTEHSSALSRSKNASTASESVLDNTDASVYLKDGKIMLHSRVPVASLSIKADGDIKWNLDAIGLQQSTSKGNVVAYSLDGATIPDYEDVVIGEYKNISIYSVSLSDSEAQVISTSLSNDVATRISDTFKGQEDKTEIYDINGYKTDTFRDGINIIKRNGTTQKIYKK